MCELSQHFRETGFSWYGGDASVRKSVRKKIYIRKMLRKSRQKNFTSVFLEGNKGGVSIIHCGCPPAPPKRMFFLEKNRVS